MNASLVSRLKVEGKRKISGDRKHDGPGHNTKYVTYSLMNQQINEITTFAVSEVVKAGNSKAWKSIALLKY